MSEPTNEGPVESFPKVVTDLWSEVIKNLGAEVERLDKMPDQYTRRTGMVEPEMDPVADAGADKNP